MDKVAEKVAQVGDDACLGRKTHRAQTHADVQSCPQLTCCTVQNIVSRNYLDEIGAFRSSANERAASINVLNVLDLVIDEVVRLEAWRRRNLIPELAAGS